MLHIIESVFLAVLIEVMKNFSTFLSSSCIDYCIEQALEKKHRKDYCDGIVLWFMRNSND